MHLCYGLAGFEFGIDEAGEDAVGELVALAEFLCFEPLLPQRTCYGIVNLLSHASAQFTESPAACNLVFSGMVFVFLCPDKPLLAVVMTIVPACIFTGFPVNCLHRNVEYYFIFGFTHIIQLKC